MVDATETESDSDRKRDHVVFAQPNFDPKPSARLWQAYLRVKAPVFSLALSSTIDSPL